MPTTAWCSPLGVRAQLVDDLVDDVAVGVQREAGEFELGGRDGRHRGAVGGVVRVAKRSCVKIASPSTSRAIARS